LFCDLNLSHRPSGPRKRLFKPGMHNIRPAGQMWPAEAFNLARELPNFVYFASFFGKQHPLNLLKHINFGPWICQKKNLARHEIWVVHPWFKHSFSVDCQTRSKDHLRIATTYLQRTTFLVQFFYNINSLNNDHLSTTATNFGSRGWSLYTSLTVVS